MKLPILLLVLVALSQALSVQPLTERSETKSQVVEQSVDEDSPSKSSPDKITVTKSSSDNQEDDSETSKRDLNEGNFGERNKETVPKYEDTGSTPKIEYANIQDTVSEQSPTHQIFGVRLTQPEISKISDVLSGHGPSFEAALTKHLYSPVSVYQARLSSPTSFEVPAPAASQSAYSDHERDRQEAPPKAAKLPVPAGRPVIPVYPVNQPELQFEAHPQRLDSGLSHQHVNLPEETFRSLNQLPKKVMSSVFPIYDQLGPFRYPGQEVPSEILQQNGVYQIVPVRTISGFGGQKGDRDKIYPKQENQEQLKSSEPKLNIPVPMQGYHAHPNGAISFASFTHNLPVKTQYETGRQPQQQLQQQQQLQSQAIPVQLQQLQSEVMPQFQGQKFGPVNQRILIPSMFQGLIQELQKYEPVYQQQPQIIPFKQQIQNQPRMLNVLQQHLLLQPHVQRLPAFKPLPQPIPAESFLQQTSRSPPRPFSLEVQPVQNENNFDLPLEPASTPLTPLPPLKPNYSKYVKPLEPQPHTTPNFLPMPLQPHSTATPPLVTASDQLISSTTVQPNVIDKENPEKQSIQKESQPLPQKSQSLTPEVTHQSQPTVQPAQIQSTTYLPFVTREPHSIFFQYSTPQPSYQATPRPSSPRHDVVIQRQEIQELFFEPFTPPSPPPSIYRYQNQQHQVPQHEQEVHLLGTQPQHQLFEQLQPLQFQHEMPDINSQPFQLKARQLKSSEKQDSSQQGEPLQHLIQQNFHPLQLQHLQPKLLLSLQSELGQLQQQQLVYQTQQHGSNHAQHLEPKLLQSLQSEQEQLQQQQLVYQTQQHGSNQAQHLQPKLLQSLQSEQEQLQQQQLVYQTQQHGSNQAQQQASEQEQQEQHQPHGPEETKHLDKNNQIQISTIKPSQDSEQQTETVEIQQQSESESQLQQQSNIQPTTIKPEEQPDHLSEPTPNVEQTYMGPILTSSDSPRIYGHQQQLVAHPEYSPLLGVPPYTDVQYFGKFAEALFGNRHH